MKNNTCIFYLMMMILLFIFIPILTNGQDNTTTTAPPELRIAIPVREFEDWVRVEHDPITGEQQISGFAIEVFKAVVNKGLSSPISYKLVPFVKSDGVTMNGTFDDMLQAVSNQEYDGAVGEISILYSRTEWVDFTLPYMDTQISMLVRQNQRPFDKGGRISLASATKYFVAATLGFSFLVAAVFWILEYRTDKHTWQLKKTASSSTNVVDDDNWRRDMLGSITHTRLVMILFFMVLLILMACYSASQTSSLSTHNGNGGFKNLNQLIRKGSNVGYRKGSFVHNLLIEKGFFESKLIRLDSDKHMMDMLAKGTKNGGVDAIVADSPNLKLLLDKNCNDYTMVPSVNLPSAGFGFAFRKGSTLTNEFSNGILRVIDNGDLERIQERTIGNFDACENDPYNSGPNPSLNNDSLWILIAGGVGVIILMIIIILLYCGFRYSNTTRKKRVIAYPCYLLPCC